MKRTLLIIFILLPFVLKAQIKIEVSKPLHFNEAFAACDDQVDATFPGGFNKFNQYLIKNIRYPVNAKKYHIQGKVYLIFVIDENGSINDVKVSKGLSKDINTEAVRVLKNSPKWNPTKMCGKAVKSRNAIKINFLLG